MARQIPARFMKVASYIAPMRDAGEQVKVDEVIHKTILMKKNSFYEYRWLIYVWVCEPEPFSH